MRLGDHLGGLARSQQRTGINGRHRAGGQELRRAMRLLPAGFRQGGVRAPALQSGWILQIDCRGRVAHEQQNGTISVRGLDHARKSRKASCSSHINRN